MRNLHSRRRQAGYGANSRRGDPRSAAALGRRAPACALDEERQWARPALETGARHAARSVLIETSINPALRHTRRAPAASATLGTADVRLAAPRRQAEAGWRRGESNP